MQPNCEEFIRSMGVGLTWRFFLSFALAPGQSLTSENIIANNFLKSEKRMLSLVDEKKTPCFFFNWGKHTFDEGKGHDIF